MNENIICDVETGICGPAGGNIENNKLEMIDFTNSQEEDKQENEK